MKTKKKKRKIKACHQKGISHCTRSWTEKHFSELIRTYTIRDYSIYPHTVYDKALPGWPDRDNIHMEHETHLVVHRNDAQTQMCVHPLKYAVKWDVVKPMKVISTALTNEQKMAVFTYSINVKCAQSHFACICLSVSVCMYACLWERLQGCSFSPLLLSYVCVDTALCI